MYCLWDLAHHNQCWQSKVNIGHAAKTYLRPLAPIQSSHVIICVHYCSMIVVKGKNHLSNFGTNRKYIACIHGNLKIFCHIRHPLLITFRQELCFGISLNLLQMENK
mmetsp:Transcript_6519/g.14085  ORF Transcript_6519/g.14085 Transcript_6519/m.14085 type:complete len:107 (-) Transcript_6519:898-1218(-)